MRSNARIPSATVAERLEGTLSASGFGVKFILFQLLGTLVNYLIRNFAVDFHVI